MDGWIWTVILSILPISELRGAIVYAMFKAGINPLTAFLIAVFFNILIIFPIFFFLDYINGFLMKIKVYNKLFNFYINKKVEKVKQKYEKLELTILFLFVAIPSPGTGAYTGCLLSWFFKLDRKKSFIAISIGVVVAGILTTILAIMGKSLFELF